MAMRRREGRTLASKVGVSQATLSAKIRRVREEQPDLSAAQAAGKATGILAGRTGRRAQLRRSRGGA